MKLFKRKVEPHPQAASCPGAIIPAFKLDGIQYYKFVDPLGTPHQRVLEAMAESSALQYNITRAHLEAFLELCDKFVTGDIQREVYIKQLVHMYDRVTWAMAPEVIYRIAACIFFDKYESPYSIDREYNNKKIERWVRAKKYEDFFLELRYESWIQPLINLPRSSLVSLRSKLGKAKQMMEDLLTQLNAPGTHPLKQDIYYVSLIMQQ